MAARSDLAAAVYGIAASQYSTLAWRSANSLLSHHAICATFGIEPRSWQVALGDILDDLIGAKT